MMNRVGRLIQAELLKLRAHPFFLVSFIVLVLATVLGGLLLGEEKETVWRSQNAIAIFAGAARVGMKLATFIAVIFGSMLFASEFDRGTIKILLTRPITRTDLFVAKSVAMILISLFLAAIVLVVGLAVGCWAGELGPVWDDQTYNSTASYDVLLDHTRRAIAMSIASIVAAGFLGLAISNAVEASSYSVAIGLTAFIVVDEVLLRAFRDDSIRRWFFNHYPTYALDVLRDFARGSAARWKEIFIEGAPYVFVPLGTLVLFGVVGYVIFRRRNITV